MIGKQGWIFPALTLLACSVAGTPIDSPSIKGYTYLGTGPSNGTSRVALQYYLSKVEMSQTGALTACGDMNYKLLSIVNSIEDQNMRLLIANVSAEQIWTSGVYDTAIRQWYWNAHGKVAFFDNFRNPVVGANSCSGITISGSLSSYGWSVHPKTNNYKFICQSE